MSLTVFALIDLGATLLGTLCGGAVVYYVTSRPLRLAPKAPASPRQRL